MIRPGTPRGTSTIRPQTAPASTRRCASAASAGGSVSTGTSTRPRPTVSSAASAAGRAFSGWAGRWKPAENPISARLPSHREFDFVPRLTRLLQVTAVGLTTE
ncbi:hypothetical protein OG599_24095 [Streptomyces sp. NBC_01335]|nr:hypothetical protein OG599_24095 [Streptomyces sp. NBC_01335]